MPVDKSMEREKSIFFSLMEMKEILPFVTTWINLESTILSEISHTEKEILCDLIYIWHLEAPNQ